MKHNYNVPGVDKSSIVGICKTTGGVAIIVWSNFVESMDFGVSSTFSEWLIKHLILRTNLIKYVLKLEKSFKTINELPGSAKSGLEIGEDMGGVDATICSANWVGSFTSELWGDSSKFARNYLHMK